MSTFKIVTPGAALTSSSLLGLLFQAGNLEEIGVVPWPLQASVGRLHSAVEPNSPLGHRLSKLERRVSPDSGVYYPAIANAFRDLLITRVLVPVPGEVTRRLTIDPTWRGRHESLLSHLDDHDRLATVQAGRWLAAATRTALKASSRAPSAFSREATA